MSDELNIDSPPLAEDEARPPHLSDDALALRFADKHESDRRYIAFTSRWLCWTGTRWETDSTLSTFDAARVVCRAAAAGCNDMRVATGIASARTVAAVERLAKSDQRLAATIDQFDTDPDLLNT